MRGHWGVTKILQALKRKNPDATWAMAKQVCELCEVCTEFCHWRAKALFGQLLFSL